MKILESVAGKLVMLVVASLVGFFGLATWYNLRVQEQASTHLLVLNGALLADVVARSIREAMLRNDRAAIDATIATLSGQREIERRHILRVLEAQAFNISRSARILGIDRVTLYNKIRR
ncbi:MAG: hypothetical protein B7X11_01690, partial [Acidobacteria bacterium 37-65-4]